MEGVLKEGDSVKVKLIGLDQKTGKFKLSRKVLMPQPEGAGARRPGGDDQRQ
jgi:polyribonucleotide nucleotidyltransferase